MVEPGRSDFGCSAAGGTMAALIRAQDWSATPFGPRDTWSQSLQAALSICLHARCPTAIYWGPALRLLYNDAWAPFLGDRHPRALGRPGSEVHADVWPVIGPQVRQVQATGEGFSALDSLVPMVRDGDTSQTWWTYSLTPIRAQDGSVAGVFAQGYETTARVLAARHHVAETERLRRMFDQAPGFMAMLRGPSHVFELANAAYLQLVGHRDVIGKPVRQVLPDVEGQGFFELLDRVFTTGQSFVGRAMPVKLQRAPGGTVEQRFLDFLYQPVTDANGAVAGIFVEGSDVTERIGAEAELRASEARHRALLAQAERRAAELRAVLESMPDAVYIGGADGIAIANQPALDQLGFASREELDRHVATLAAEIQTRDARTGAPIGFEEQAFVRAFRGEHVVQDVLVRHRLTGEDRVVRCAAAPVVVDGKVIAAVAVNSDVTEHRRAEERLRELNATLEAQVAERTAALRLHRDIIESHPTPICAFDTEMRLTVFNRAHSDEFCRIFGRQVRRGDCFPATFPPDQAPQVRQWTQRALAGEVFTITGEFGDPQLARLHWESRYAPLRDAEGRIIGGFHHALDITERVRAETELQQAQEALRQSQKMEAIGQLTGGIAHDFNNLLSAVVGGLDLIRRRPNDAERVRHLAEHGLAAAERGARLTSQLLAFSRAQELEMKPLVVAELVEGMRDMLARALGPQVRLTFDLDQARVPVWSDPTQLEMAVLNLAINARDAMPEGGELTIGTAARRIGRDPELPGGEYVELTVSDTGEGMPPEVVARAFEPFYTTKGVGKGTGLGLSQVYGIARQSGGTVRIDSRPGAGTTVRLWLRRTEAALPALPGDRASVADPDPATATILVIDDDEDVRAMLADSLDSLGYRVVEAVDGPTGLATLRNRAVDVVLLDFAMPGMNGAEVAQAIRRRQPDLPIVFASGYADIPAIERAAGPDAPMLRKPFRIDELQAVVAAVLLQRS